MSLTRDLRRFLRQDTVILFSLIVILFIFVLHVFVHPGIFGGRIMFIFAHLKGWGLCVGRTKPALIRRAEIFDKNREETAIVSNPYPVLNRFWSIADKGTILTEQETAPNLGKRRHGSVRKRSNSRRDWIIFGLLWKGLRDIRTPSVYLSEHIISMTPRLPERNFEVNLSTVTNSEN